MLHFCAEIKKKILDEVGCYTEAKAPAVMLSTNSSRRRLAVEGVKNNLTHQMCELHAFHYSDCD